MNLFSASSTASSIALASLVHELVQCLFLQLPQKEEQLVPSAEKAHPMSFLMIIQQKLLVFSASSTINTTTLNTRAITTRDCNMCEEYSTKREIRFHDIVNVDLVEPAEKRIHNKTIYINYSFFNLNRGAFLSPVCEES